MKKSEARKPMHECDTVCSRITGKEVKISMGPHGGGLVPKHSAAAKLKPEAK